MPSSGQRAFAGYTAAVLYRQPGKKGPIQQLLWGDWLRILKKQRDGWWFVHSRGCDGWIQRKLVLDARHRALYFSRALIPYPRDTKGKPPAPSQWLLHIGIYAYRREFLLQLANLSPTPLEQREKLERLRALEHGFPIAVALVERAAVGIDTPEDYAAFVQRCGR